MRVAILSTGDELTTGRTLDTNANYLADQLLAIGCEVTAMMTVGDFPGTHRKLLGGSCSSSRRWSSEPVASDRPPTISPRRPWAG